MRFISYWTDFSEYLAKGRPIPFPFAALRYVQRVTNQIMLHFIINYKFFKFHLKN